MKSEKLVTFAVLLLTLEAAFAAPPAVSENPSADCEALNEIRTRTEKWADIWATVWSATTVGQLTAAGVVTSSSTRADLLIGSGSAALGLIPTVFMRPNILRSSCNPGSARSEGDAQKIFDQSVVDYERNTGWVAHLANVAVNLGVSSLLGFGLKHWDSAAISAAAGIPLGELMIHTYPGPGERLSSVSFELVPSASGGECFLSWNF